MPEPTKQWVIRRNIDGTYYTHPDARKPFTRFMNNAWRFDDKAKAEANCPSSGTVVEFKLRTYPWSWRPK